MNAIPSLSRTHGVPERACAWCGEQADVDRGWWHVDRPPYRGWFCNACLDKRVGLRYDAPLDRYVPTMFGERLPHFYPRPRAGLMRFGVRA